MTLRRAGSRVAGLWMCGAVVLAAACSDGRVERGALGEPPPLENGVAGERSPVDRAPVHPLDERPAFESSGMDSTLLAEALELGGNLPRLHTMIVARHGEVVAERHVRGRAPGTPTNVKSVSKTLLSAVVGLAVADGYLEGVDQPVTSFFPEIVESPADSLRNAITLGHLLSMTSGLESTSGRNYGRWVNSPDWVRFAINRPMQAPPGERMIYSTGSTHLLSAIVSRSTGRSTHAYARERLAEPLGIELPPWLQDPQGIHFGGNDMVVSARGLLTFGEMYRNGGVHRGQQIIPRSWVEASWTEVARSPRNQNIYGLGWWGRTSSGYHVRFAWGYGGQFIFVVPALELTVVFTSDPISPREGPHNRSLHDMVDSLLVPAAMRGAGTLDPGATGRGVPGS